MAQFAVYRGAGVALMLTALLSGCEDRGREEAQSIGSERSESASVLREGGVSSAVQPLAWDSAVTATDPNRVSPTTDYAAFGACDPLVPDYCMFPWPNNFWQRVDASTVTGNRMGYVKETLPKDDKGKTIDPTEWNTLDGFSPMPAIMTYFKDVSLDNVPHWWDMASSLDADSPTIILDAETGEKLAHFAELDFTSGTSKPQTFMLWASRRLKDGHRYIVAMRDLKNRAGEVIAPSDAFRALRDNVATSNPEIEGRRAVYADIFTRLASAGFARSSLQLAWDFTTASQENLTGRLVWARDDALNRIPAGGPEYRIKNIQDFDTATNSTIGRQINLEYRVPYYTDKPGPGSVLVLDASGNPVMQGWTWVPATIRIPHLLIDSPRGGRILQYGHGLLGGQSEVESGYLGEEANRYGYVLCATDWWGMSAYDSVSIVMMMLRDISDFKIIPDRSTQGLVNFVLLMRMMMGDFSRDASVTFNGISVIDPSKRSYFGNSQGGILGGAYMAISPDIEYGVLGVPGAPYGILLPRSVDFSPFFAILKSRYKGSFDRIMLLSVMDQLWDRAEPSGYLNAISEDLLPNTPEHRVIFHYGLGDAQVSYLGAEMMARSVGAVLFDPYSSEGDYPISDIELAYGPVERSVLVPYDFGVPDVPVTNTPPDETYDTHEKPRRERTAQDQMFQFFETGVVTPTCSGKCDPS